CSAGLPTGTCSVPARPPPPSSCWAGTSRFGGWRQASPMLPEGAIHSDRLWKRFRADQRRRLLRDEIARLQARLRGVPGSGWRWALRDVTFSAEPGESVGLVGANGSGKSTLLKILARVMYPYAGRVEVGGRVGALIEVRS